VRIVSVISEALFAVQPHDYREAVLPFGVPTFGLTAGLPAALKGVVGPLGTVAGLTRFGASAPYKVLDEKFGYTKASVVARVRAYLTEYSALIDNQLTLDAWHDQAPTSYTVDVDLSAGPHTLRYEYYKWIVGATAQLTWAPILQVPADAWTAEYFANRYLADEPTTTMEEIAVFVDHAGGRAGPSRCRRPTSRPASPARWRSRRAGIGSR
jgi:hypothetical protein